MFIRYDNFSHFGGFIGGIMITVATLPMSPSYLQKHNDRFDYAKLIWLIRIIMVAFIAVLLWVFLYIFIHNGSKKVCIQTILMYHDLLITSLLVVMLLVPIFLLFALL